MLELLGDSARGEDWAAVRLRVDRGRIVDADASGLAHDLRGGFRKAIVEPFVRGYARGETPNPCIRCNGSFRFAQLLAFARRAGAPVLATGHYARIVEHAGGFWLRAPTIWARTRATCSP